MMSFYIGIDPGLTGAIAVLDSYGKYVEVVDMHVIKKEQTGSFVKSQVCSVNNFLMLHHYARKAEVMIENVTARPGQGVSSMFSLGDSFGCIRGIVGALQMPTHLVTAAQWKKAVGVTQEKDSSINLARQLFPDAPLTRKKDHGRAEALLLAYYLYRQASWGMQDA